MVASASNLEPAYLGNRQQCLGGSLYYRAYTVIYRSIEAKEMIICEFRRLTPGQPRPQQLFHLLGLYAGYLCITRSYNTLKDVDNHRRSG